jgi:cell wall-associated NlpC family hydrolase
LTYAVPGAVVAPTPVGFFSTGHLRRLLLLFTAIGLAIALIAIEAPPPTQAGSLSESQKIVRIAKSYIGARFRIGATGYRYFDCSGFVFRVYKQAGLLNRIGGSQMRAAGYYHWFKRRGLLARSNPRVGDLIWWTKHGTIKHIGIYVGHGDAISALVNPYGVRRHSVNGIHVRFLAYGHVRLDR